MLTTFASLIRWFKLESEDGVTAIEYGLLATLVALAIVVGATALGGALNAMFAAVVAAL